MNSGVVIDLLLWFGFLPVWTQSGRTASDRCRNAYESHAAKVGRMDMRTKPEF